MENAICTVAAAPVRVEPAHRTEMCDQLLFGQTMQVLERKGEWVNIRTSYDSYEGWITEHLISPFTGSLDEEAEFVATGLVNPVTSHDKLINAPMGAFLVGYDPETRLLWDETYKYHGTLRDTRTPMDLDLLWRTSQAWLNAPYLWGGKTFMGVDCSGFVQTVFRILGIRIPRDAWQQALKGEETDLQNARTGDLAFFHNENGKITHVALVLQPGQVIHSSGKVRVDALDESGIINSDHGRRTHTFNCVRRYF